MTTTPSMYIHNIHHHNDILNINNISSQCYYQHQPHVISMSFSASTSSHLNDVTNIFSCHIIINNNIILISILSPITILYQYYHHLISTLSLITTYIYIYTHTHTHTYKFHVWDSRSLGLHITQISYNTIHNIMRLVF